MEEHRKRGSCQCFPSKHGRHLGLERVRKTRTDREGNSTRFVSVTSALSYVVSIPFETGLGYSLQL